MKLLVRLYRVAKVPTIHLLAATGLAEDASADHLRQALVEKFGPLAYRLKFFFDGPSVMGRTTIVGMESMGFDICDPKIPQAGIVDHDPLIPADVHRADGALHSELARMGVHTDVDEFDWRCAFEVRGN